MQRAPSTLEAQSLPALPSIPLASAVKVKEPVKRIQSDTDVQVWQQSKAHEHLTLFVARLCESAVGKPTECLTPSDASSEDGIDKVWRLLDVLQHWAAEIEPLKTPQRFGNLAFRTWGQRLEQKSKQLHEQLLPTQLHGFIPELEAYMQGGFGSWIRLDYGSGHELSFAAWLCILQRIGLFGKDTVATEGEARIAPPSKVEERLALQIMPKYLEVVWTLQDRYGLEPAGSHGVWGLDDYQFIPYAIGAAQLRAQNAYTPMAVISPSHKPDPSPMSPLELLQFQPTSSPLPNSRSTSFATATSITISATASSLPLPGPPFANLYTTSIARIHSLKRGPFNEHSPILHDVATTVQNWVKVHGGMMKMWQAECLNKRPVVQHFPFGGVAFVWPVNDGVVRQEPAAPTNHASVISARTQQTQALSMASSIHAPTAAPWKKT